MKRRLILQHSTAGNRRSVLSGVSLAEDLPRRVSLGFRRQMLERQTELSALQVTRGREGKTHP